MRMGIQLINSLSRDTYRPMFEKRSGSGYVLALPGIERKTLAYGANTLMTEFRLQKGSALPRHSHEHE